MKKQLFLTMALLMVTAISVGPFGSVAAANDAGAGLFTDSSLAGSLDTSTAAVRSRYVDVHFDALGAAWAKRGHVLELNLFNDVSFKAVLKKVNKVSPNGFAYVGRLRGIDLSSVNIVVEDGLMAANIVFPGGVYQVRYAGSGVHVVYEVDQSAYPPEAEPIPVDLPADAGADKVSADAVAFDTGSQIDVLVVYTDDARAAAGGTTAMSTLIDLAISETNTSYVNSAITQRVRLVHKAEVAYDEADFNWSTTLERLTNTSDGYMDNVHTLRDTYKADEVVLLVANSVKYCGIAWGMTAVSNAFNTKAFALVNWDCATGKFTFGHELGHNMGATHDWYVTDTKDSPYTYNKGYVNPGATTATRWRTMMAYDDECVARGFNCTRIPYWSTPLRTYGGLKMGVASGSNSTCTTGNLSNANCDADNRRVLNNTAYTVANFRVGSAPAGFSSDFNTSHPNWVTHKGAWSHKSSKYYSTNGVAGNFSSISYNAIYSTLTYEVKMMRSGSNVNANYVSIRGTPTPLHTVGHWYNGYVFAYINDGQYAVWKVNGAAIAPLKEWTTSAAIVKKDWNTLKVTANGTALKFYINGTLVWSGTDAWFSAGRVGIGMERAGTSIGNRLDVDWATLTTAVADEVAEPVVAGEELPGGDDTGHILIRNSSPAEKDLTR